MLSHTRIHARLLPLLIVALGLAAALSVARADEPAGIISVPFAPKSGPRGATLFTTLPPERTGLKAVDAYTDPTMWTSRYREFTLGAIGSGVAIGDYDGDGRPDIFVVNKTGRCQLFRNLGDFHFEDVTDRAGVGGPEPTPGVWNNGVAMVDVNNDGRLDIYVGRFNAPNLLYINQGDGSFKEEAAQRGLALNDATGMAAFCDYDRDGWLDVYVQTNLLDGERHPEGQVDHLYHNNGDGTFTDVSERAGISGTSQGHAATWWDFDEDGWPDLYVDNDFKDPDKLYHNNRDGTFTNVLSFVVPHTPQSSMGADLGDVNNDGHIDLFVADMAATTRHKDHRGMAKLRAGVVDDEDRPQAAPQYMRNALFLNTGAGVVLEGADLAGIDATDWTWSPRFEDLDNDGRLDLFITNGIMRELHSIDILARMSTKESLEERYRIMRASPELPERNLAFRNLGDLRFEDVGPAWGLERTSVSFGSAFGDLDGDGDLDLVYVTMNGELTVCRNDSDTNHSIVVALRGTVSNRFGVGATVHLDTAAGPQVRSLVLARGYDSTSEPILHFGLGGLTTVARLTVDWPSGRRQIFTNLAADRRYTITEPAAAASVPPPKPPRPQFAEVTEATHLAVPNHEKHFNPEVEQPLVPFRFEHPGPPVVVADFDGDAEDDVALGGVAGEGGRLFSNLGGGMFLEYGGSVFDDRADVADGPMVAIDANADGALDLLVTKAGLASDPARFQPMLLLNDRTGRFSPAPAGWLPSLPISVGAAVAADFEHSGRLGIFLGGRVQPGEYPQAPRSALLAWRDGKYVDVADELAPGLAHRGMVAAALWCDVDGDGWPDLIVAYDWGPVVCYRNVDGKKFEDASAKLGFAAAGTGWWRSLAVADFNGDGRPDIAVGNVGLNTRYRDSATLYAGVALDGQPPQLVEAQAEHGVWYPLKTREVLAQYFPSLMRRFPTADSYARAPLEQVFPADVLAKATKYTASELRSGVFLSQPDGTYRFAPLPRLAQIAPIFGLAAGDFDGDGHVDLMVVGNSFAPPPETTRFDGGVGWLLRGDGRGGFTPAPVLESGWIVRRDAKALAVVDFDQDGWPDFYVTRNNDTPLAFHNGGRPGRHSFGVRLRGRPGNPEAVGARLTLTLADGATETGEIAAGSGYFSQSSPLVFFGWPDGNPPKQLKIRWPDGRESVQTFNSPPFKIVRAYAP